MLFKLTGKEAHVLLGASFVWQLGPLHHVGRPDPATDQLLDDVTTRLRAVVRASEAANGLATQNYSGRSCLEIVVELVPEERLALSRAVEACASELTADPGADVNILYEGNQFGVTVDDYLRMGQRMREVPSR